MSSKLFTLILFFLSSFAFAQIKIENEEVDSFVNDFCECFDSDNGVILQKCVSSSEKRKNHPAIMYQLIKNNFNYDSNIMYRIQLSLAENCNSYVDYIINKSVDTKSLFNPFILEKGKELCVTFSKLKDPSIKTLDSIILSFFKKNKTAILTTSTDHKNPYKELLRVSVINCPIYRKLTLIESLNLRK